MPRSLVKCSGVVNYTERVLETDMHLLHISNWWRVPLYPVKNPLVPFHSNHIIMRAVIALILALRAS